MPKRTTKKGITTKGRSRDTLVVASKVKAYIKGKKMNTSAEAINTLSDQVYTMIDNAATRSKANGRKTVKGQDI
jgi:histone H3/H4